MRAIIHFIGCLSIERRMGPALIVMSQPSTDLLGTPALPDQCLDLLPGGLGDTRAYLGRLPGLSQAMGLERAIASEAAVAPQFSTDRGFMHTHHRGYLGLVLISFQ